MDIEIRLKEDSFVMVIGNLDSDDEISTYDMYAYDEQENQLMFKLTWKQMMELKSDLNGRAELLDEKKFESMKTAERKQWKKIMQNSRKKK